MNLFARCAVALTAGYMVWLACRIAGPFTPLDVDLVAGLGFVAGTALGYFAAPQVARVMDRAAAALDLGIGGLSASEALAGAIGLTVGLAIAFSVRILYFDLGLLRRYGPEPFYALWLPIVLFFAFAGARIGRRRSMPPAVQISEKLLDTSAIIDGRIVDIVATGFIDGTLTVPRFVLAELQMLADSGDAMRRARGKRGLEILERLRAATPAFAVLDIQADDRDVDGKLVTLARQRGARILTNDFNLNRVARLQGVEVLNIHELSIAVKAVALPGEEMAVSIVKDGKELNQGVGFLDDGTMVVVENGKERRGEQVGVEVTSVLQTAAGRMIFAKLKR